MNIKNWIPENQIDILAENAASSYEMNNNWEEASRITYEYASDELGIKPSHTAMRLVIQRAKTIWNGETMRVKAIITNAEKHFPEFDGLTAFKLLSDELAALSFTVIHHFSECL